MKVESWGSLGWQVGRGTCVAWATLVCKCLVPSQPGPGRRPQKMPLAILSPFCFIRGRVELAPCFTLAPLVKVRFFRTKS